MKNQKTPKKSQKIQKSASVHQDPCHERVKGVDLQEAQSPNRHHPSTEPRGRVADNDNSLRGKRGSQFGRVWSPYSKDE